MESESAGGSGDAVRDAPIVFISDASAEAERLTLALRARRYVVVDVPLALLPGRVAVQLPALVVCDADSEGAMDALRRIRDVRGDRPVPVLLLCHGDRTISTLDSDLVAGAFARPVNVPELVATVERLVGRGASGPPSMPPPSARGSKVATSSRPPMRASAAPRSVIDRSARADPGGPSTAVAPLPPDLAGDAAPRDPGDAPVVELSRDIQQILLDAERRLGESRPGPASGREEHGPEVDAEGPLPPEVLVALEEPLDEEDLSDEGRTPEPQDRTGGLTGHKVGVRGHTQIGGGGTAATSLGTDGTGAPASERSFASGQAAGARGAGLTQDGSAAERETGPGSSGDDDARRTRQQASTPKPPRPTAEDLARGTSMEPEPRISMPPPTVAENAIPDGPVPSARTNEITPPPSLAHGAAGAGPGTRRDSDRPATSRGPVPSIDGADRRDLTSTTPPVRRREDSAPPPARHASDRPAAPKTALPKRPSERPEPKPAEDRSLDIPATLRAGDAVVALAKAIGTRYTGAVAFEVDEGIRRVVLREGDFVTVASGVHGESLVAFLAGRGDLPAEVARQGHKLPPFGRRAGAALIAHGHLAQDQLWPVLRSHAEWLIGRVLLIERGSASVEEVGKLQEEPAVFGGATGAEVLVEVTRRVVPPEDGIERLGGMNAVLGAGPARALLGECALSAAETEHVQGATGSPLKDLLDASPDPSLASALYALVALGVLATEGARPRPRAAAPTKAAPDELDDGALRARILARKALVDDGDYFAVLGVSREATGYDIRRAYTSLRRELEPSHVLTSKTADLVDVVDEIVEVLEEAYQILSDQRRRDRYRRAIDATP